MKKLYFLSALFISLCISSCQPDEDLITPDLDLIYKVKSTEILLRDNTWGFHDFIVDVKYEMRAIPLLANVADADGMVQPGQYNSLAIFGNDHRQQLYSYQFETVKINRDTTGTGLFHDFAYYNVLNRTKIKINPDSIGKATYDYKYLEDEELFVMTSDQLSNGTINDAINKVIADAILSGKPNDIANAVVGNILGNENLQDTIQYLLYDMIHGKLAAIAESPEEISQKLASFILEKLKEVDWESRVYDKLVELLEALKVEDPEQAAQVLAAQIADRIETSTSQSDIYDAILPVLEKFENENLPEQVTKIAEAIYGVIAKTFSEENLYERIYPVWINFSETDSSSLSSVADTLGAVITDHFFDAGTLANSLEPFMATLRSTSILKIPDLAQEIIDETLIPLVDSLNATFLSLDLDPDWVSIKPILTSSLTVIKASIDNQTDTEAAASLAENIIEIMDSAISRAVETAIFYFQGIPAEQASQVIAAWISNLVTVAEPQVVSFLEGKLNEVADLFHAEEVAEELSAKIYAEIMEFFDADNIYNLILPFMERLNEINVEAAAGKIADWLTDLELIKDNISEEQVLEALAEVIGQLIGNMNVDEASQKLADLILQSEIINSMEGRVLKQLLELKTYEFLLELGRDINAIEKVEISIVRK